MSFIIRPEAKKDHADVAILIKAAFANDAHSDQTEQLLVARLRNSDAFIPQLSIVAELGDQVVGHILLAKIKIVNEQQSFDSLALAPVSVLPAFQKKGVGGKLILAAHEKAKDLGFKSIVLVGHADYYPRFGYALASKHNITLPFGAPDENCMVIELIEGGLDGVSGKVVYPKEFG